MHILLTTFIQMSLINGRSNEAFPLSAVGGFSAGGQSAAAQSAVLHVSLSGARYHGSLPAPGAAQTAGCQRLLHHHHPSHRSAHVSPPVS